MSDMAKIVDADQPNDKSRIAVQGCVGGPHVRGVERDCIYCDYDRLQTLAERAGGDIRDLARMVIDARAQREHLRAAVMHVLAVGQVGKQSRQRLEEALTDMPSPRDTESVFGTLEAA